MQLSFVLVAITLASVSATEFLRQSSEGKGKDGPKGKGGKGKDDDDIESIAEANFVVWAAALKSKNADQITALYVPSGLSFLPTLSPDHIKEAVATRAYFVELQKKDPEVAIDEEKVFSMGKDAYVHTGLYTFTLGGSTVVKARFSYMWGKVGKKWLIHHHHSSVSPESTSSLALISEHLILKPTI